MESLKLLMPPPYCRKISNKTTEENQLEQIPSLKLAVSNPAKILQLCEKLTSDSSKSLEVKINSYLMDQGKSKTSFLVHLSPLYEEAVVRTVGKRELEKSLLLPVSRDVIKGLVEYENKTFTCKESLNPQLMAVLNAALPDTDNQIIVVPILSRKEKYFPCATHNLHPVLLTCFVDSLEHEDFLMKLAGEVFRYCQVILLNTIATEEEERLKRQSQSLAEVGRKLYKHVEDLHCLFKEIINEAKKLTNAQRCSLFLLDPDRVLFIRNVFDTISCNKIEVKLAAEDSIAEHVASTGHVLNIKDPYDHPLFDKETDKTKDHRTKNILSFPVENDNNVVAVVQLSNKRCGSFTRFDEEAVNIFSTYCGLAITHSLIYKQTKENQIRNQIANKIMLRQFSITDEDVVKKVNCPLMHIYKDFDQFSFNQRDVNPNEIPCLILIMFEELGFIESFNIKKHMFMKFIMLVQKNYSDAPHHNFMHAFSACHFAYLCLKKLQLVEKQYISNLEAMAYFVSSLCHDLDHRGIYNSFRQNYNKVLAAAYSSQGSVMERHHVSQTLCILNLEGCNFLEPLSRKDYTLWLSLMKDLILTTDVAAHFKFYEKLYLLTQSGYDCDNAEHRYILAGLLMTCADFADQIKDWPTIRRETHDVFQEFFAVPALKEAERNTLADLVFLPDLQIGFLRDICLPAFKILAFLFEPLRELVQKVKLNILCWEVSKHIFQRGRDDGLTGMEILNSEEFENEVQEDIKKVMPRAMLGKYL